MALKVVEEWFNACAGCEVSILNIGENLVDLLSELEFVHMPFLIDHKYYGQTGEGTQLEIPEADVAIVSGGVRTEEQKEILQKIREKCKTLVALGTCAINGGIPAMTNMWKGEEILNAIYSSLPSEVPAWLDRVYAIDEIAKVDIYIPGCPPHPQNINEAINARRPVVGPPSDSLKT